MKKRLITTAVGLPLLFLVLYAYNTLWFDLVLTAACLLGYYEAFHAYAQKETVSLLAAISVLTSVAFLTPAMDTGRTFTAEQRELFNGILIFLFAAFLIGFTIRNFLKLDIARMAGAVLMSLLVLYCFGTVLFLKRQLPFERYGYLGAFLFLLALAYAWGGDSFAYLVGRAFGKRKMCPAISPHKTVAGGLGAPVGSVLFGVLFLWLYDLLMPVLQPFAVLHVQGWMYAAVALLGIPASLLGMGGDLYASCVKRQVGIKDYGTILPGQGGILDRFDSAIPVLGLVASCAYAWVLLS